MRMMHFKGDWYHILGEVETPFHKEEDFQKQIDYIILENDLVKLFRPSAYRLDERIITQQRLFEMISKIESETWRIEEYRITHLNYYKKVSQILREFIIEKVLVKEVEYEFDPILLAC